MSELKAEIDFVVFAGSPYRVAMADDNWVSIYDEEPHSLHVDMVKRTSCKEITREEAFAMLNTRKPDDS